MFNSGPLKSHWKNPHKMNPAARRLESHWEASKSQKTTKESHRKNHDLWKNRNTRTLSFQLCVNSSAVSQSKCQKRPPPTTQVRWVYKLGESSKLSRLVIVSFLTSWRAIFSPATSWSWILNADKLKTLIMNLFVYSHQEEGCGDQAVSLASLSFSAWCSFGSPRSLKICPRRLCE